MTVTTAGARPAPADLSQVTGSVHSWDLSTGVDGPGTRFVLFTAGCPLRCVYCHNPDTWSGRNGQRMSAAAVLAQAGRYRRFIRAAGGGLTVSGGEPLLQPAFTRAVLAGAKDLGLHTALDTSGYLGARAGDELLDATDLVLLDIKSFDPGIARRVTGRNIAPTLAFARRLADRHQPVWVRFVLVPGWTDDRGDITALARFTASLGNVERVDVLPFHTLGAAKYAALGLDNPCAGVAPPTAEQVGQARAVFTAAGLDAF
ncbi:MAG TPA: pyruvate formate-lyase-activating protein [Streptosporangiaceae bacterium]|nr:pyruvate formate-lyase-activating protein [Streptosporangiaceae bacterium]